MPRPRWLPVFAIVALGAALDFACRNFPAELPFFLPWEFSWPVYLTVSLTLLAFVRGLRRHADMPRWRSLCFISGVMAMYCVVQTHFDYLSQHLFFMHRLQHLVLHHMGPFLIGVAGVDSVLWAGLPETVKPALQSHAVQRLLDIVQNPVVAPLVFIGLIYFWLIPAVHTPAMLDTTLFQIMNWSMAIDGVLFWSMLLDPRGKPPARASQISRAILALAITPPQVAVGALISLTHRDLYPVYRICGRVFAISASVDQQLGGLILWAPPAMMSAAALIIILYNSYWREAPETSL